MKTGKAEEEGLLSKKITRQQRMGIHSSTLRYVCNPLIGVSGGRKGDRVNVKWIVESIQVFV